MSRTITLDNWYSIKARRGQIKIYPSSRGGNGRVTIGVGNAKIAIDPVVLRQKQTVFMRAIITDDANGTYIAPLDFDYSRGTKSYTGTSQETVTIKGKSLTVKKLDGFVDTSKTNGSSSKVLLTADIPNNAVDRRIVQW